MEKEKEEGAREGRKEERRKEEGERGACEATFSFFKIWCSS